MHRAELLRCLPVTAVRLFCFTVENSEGNVTPHLRKLLFETLYKNRYLYRFASTVPFAGQWRVWQRLVLPRIHGHDVLEIGCGLGDLLADMLEAGYMCRGIDASPQMVAAARATLHRRNLGPASWVLQGETQRLPFSDNMFDTVVSTFPNEYIYDPATIAEVTRVLRPGGRIVIIESTHLFPVGYFQPFLLLIHALIYGPGVLFQPSEPGRATQNRDQTRHEANSRTRNLHTISEELPAAWFGRLIPLEEAGLRRRSERIVSERWEAYIIIGEKPAEN